MCAICCVFVFQRKHDGVYGLTAGDTFTIEDTYQVITPIQFLANTVLFYWFESWSYFLSILTSKCRNLNFSWKLLIITCLSYTLKVHTQRGKEIHLLRMRDPLGYTIWKGPWNQKWVVLNLKSTDLQNILSLCYYH